MADGASSDSRELSAADDSKQSIDLDANQRRQHRTVFAIIGGILTIFIVVSTTYLFGSEGEGYFPFTCIQFHVSDDLFKTFLWTVFLSVFAIGATITKSLFPGEGGVVTSFFEMLRDVFSKRG